VTQETLVEEGEERVVHTAEVVREVRGKRLRQELEEEEVQTELSLDLREPPMEELEQVTMQERVLVRERTQRQMLPQLKVQREVVEEEELRQPLPPHFVLEQTAETAHWYGFLPTLKMAQLHQW